jgi:hypothetical protein
MKRKQTNSRIIKASNTLGVTIDKNHYENIKKFIFNPLEEQTTIDPNRWSYISQGV